MKTKKCRNKDCGQPFQPFRTTQVVCSPKCAIAYSNEQQRKKTNREQRERRKRDKNRLEELQPKKYWIRKTQRAFNQWIRLRDGDDPCISCHTTQPGHDSRGGLWDCGHYRSIGSAPHLRFDERNAHKQCKKCNQQLSGNIVEYRKRLLVKIGEQALEDLESNYEVVKWTVDDLKVMFEYYSLRIKELKAKE